MKPRLVQAVSSQPSMEERYHKARLHLRNVGVILSLYSSAIRAIVSAPSILKTNDAQTLNSFAARSAYSPIRISPTLTEAILLAAKELYPNEFSELEESDNFDLRKVIKLFTASEISSVLGITYFFKLAAKNLDKDEFNRIAPILSVHLHMGGLIGAQSGSNFGRGGGMAATGLRCLAIAVLIKANLKGFRKYRRIIEETGILSHSTLELELFGCTHLDVACALAGELGFGPVAREAFLGYQFNSTNSSIPTSILWTHTLKEASKLWATRQTLNSKSQKKENKDFLDSLDGYKWLWGTSSSQDLLPGVDLEEIASLIPAQDADTQDNFAASTILQQPTKNQSILIVEDEPASAKILERYLRPLGKVSTQGTAESAIALLNIPQQNIPFNIILLDIGLPGMSGVELLNAIREIEKGNGTSDENRCKVLMITGDEDPQTVMKAFSNGADGYLTKPLKREEVKEELAKHNIILGS